MIVTTGFFFFDQKTAYEMWRANIMDDPQIHQFDDRIMELNS